MLGHRVLNVEDYLAILKRRWWIICIPAVLLPIVCVAITFFITPQYTSQSRLLIQQQKVSADVVKPLDMGDLNSRLALITAQIKSRSTLEPIINKYNLYASQHLSIDDRVELIRTKNLQIAPIQDQMAGGLPGFSILFTADDPHTAQQVCADITGLYTQHSLEQQTETTEGTTQFLQAQIDEERHKLDDMDKKRADFESKYMGSLPGDENNSSNMLNSLTSQLQATTGEIQNLQQNKALMEVSLNSLTQAATPAVSAVKTEQADQVALTKEETNLSDLQLHYTDDYPEVKAAKRRIADLQAQIAKEAAAPAPVVTSPTNRPDSLDVAQLKTRIRLIDEQIVRDTQQQSTLQAQMRSFEGRIAASPEVQDQYTVLTRDYATENQIYQGLLASRGKSQMSVEMTNSQQGESFNVADPANLPIDPTYPKQSVFALGGLGGGIALGLLIVAFLEYRDTALRTERDVWAFTQLPTLAVVAWSGVVDTGQPEKPGLFKRLFSRKESKELLAG